MAYIFFKKNYPQFPFSNTKNMVIQTIVSPTENRSPSYRTGTSQER